MGLNKTERDWWYRSYNGVIIGIDVSGPIGDWVYATRKIRKGGIFGLKKTIGQTIHFKAQKWTAGWPYYRERMRKSMQVSLAAREWSSLSPDEKKEWYERARSIGFDKVKGYGYILFTKVFMAWHEQFPYWKVGEGVVGGSRVDWGCWITVGETPIGGDVRIRP